MQVKIISFDYLLDRIKRKNIDDILYVDIKEEEIMQLYEVDIDKLAYYSRDDGFFIKVTEDGEWYGVDKCKRWVAKKKSEYLCCYRIKNGTYKYAGFLNLLSTSREVPIWRWKISAECYPLDAIT